MTYFIFNMPVHASEISQHIRAEVMDLGRVYSDANAGIALLSESNGDVDLTSGNYERWIDRIDVPDYAYDFYDTLVEYTDNDGFEDLMITDSGYAKETAITKQFGDGYGSDVFHAIKYTQLENPTQNEIIYVYKTMRAVYDAYDMDHPEVFWFSGVSYGYCLISQTDSNTVLYEFYFLIKMHEGSHTIEFDIRSEEYQSEAAVRSDITARDNAVNAIINTDSVNNAEDDYETVKALNEWLTMNNEYNWEVYANNTTHRVAAHKCISALTGGKGVNRPVCEGYSKAMKVLCDRLGIPCVVTTGNSYSSHGSNAEPHSWNYVRIDGVWYGLDITWNDPAVSGSPGPVSGYESEDYFLVGTDTIIGKMPFRDSHVSTNTVSNNGLPFINAPILSPEKYFPKEETEDLPVEVSGINRIAGDTRYETSLAIANEVKLNLGTEKFHTIIVASGKSFADALAGNYLSAKTNSPILMTNGNNSEILSNYISENLITGGTIYILGGTAAVSENVEDAFNGLGTIQRLAGDNRYDTNLAILKESRINQEDILVCTGSNFADSLSASAAKKPILLVNDKLSMNQQAYLGTLNTENFYIIGGTAAVDACIESELAPYGTVSRIYGTNRRETSIAVAKTFFTNPKTVVIASAANFPDGLCGGPLATALDAPLILTADGKTTEAKIYIKENEIHSGYVLGGTDMLSDVLVQDIYSLNGI